MAKKLALIDPQLLLDLLGTKSASNPPNDPELAKMNEIDRRVSSSLNAIQPDANSQLRNINSLLTKYETHRENYEKTPIGPPQKTVLPRDETKEIVEEKPDDLDIIVTTLPKTKQRQARLLLEHMKRQGITWDTQGRVKIKDKYLESSNITDIIHSFVRKRPTQRAAKFAGRIYDELARVNTPLELMGRERPLGATDDNDSDYEPAAGSPYLAGAWKKI